jgi:hypothetical protein
MLGVLNFPVSTSSTSKPLRQFQKKTLRGVVRSTPRPARRALEDISRGSSAVVGQTVGADRRIYERLPSGQALLPRLLRSSTELMKSSFPLLWSSVQ